MKIRKLVLAAVGASVMLGSLVASSASARVFSTDTQSIRALFSEVIFREPLGASTNCHLTLEGSLHSVTIDKTPGTLIGNITRAVLGPCNGTQTATVLSETLPWNVRYSGFQGRLPEITSLITHVIGAAFRARLSNGITCLARTELNEPAIGRFHFDNGGSSHVRVGIEGAIRTTCIEITGRFSTELASNYVVRSGTSTPISVRLI
jgi:hypothetical protein